MSQQYHHQAQLPSSHPQRYSYAAQPQSYTSTPQTPGYGPTPQPQGIPQGQPQVPDSSHSFQSVGRTPLQQQMSLPVSHGPPVASGGTSMADLIAAKAASRKPMATSPTRRDMPKGDDDRGVLLRSATLSGMKRYCEECTPSNYYYFLFISVNTKTNGGSCCFAKEAQ